MFRTLRAAVFAALCVTVSLVLHLLAGGARVPGELTAVATVLTAAGAFALAGRRRGRGTLLGASFVAQYGMHHLFGATAVVAATPVTAGPATTGLVIGIPVVGGSTTIGSLFGVSLFGAPVTTGSVTADSVTTGSLSAGSVTAVHHGSALVPGLAMLLAHALVAVLSAWWLERGESALATMLRLAACTLLEIWGRLATPISSPESTRCIALPVIAEVAAGVDRLLVSVLSGRGPPHFRSPQFRPYDIGSPDVSLSEFRSLDIDSPDFSPREFGSREFGSREFRSSYVSFA